MPTVRMHDPAVQEMRIEDESHLWDARNNTPWSNWISTATTTNSTINIVWNNWTQTSGTVTGYTLRADEPATIHYDTNTNWRAEWQEAAERRAEQARANAEAAEQAAAKAAETLKSLLDTEQWESWERAHFFELHVEDRKYRVHRGVSGNVRLLNTEDQEVTMYCAHPRTSVIGDNGEYLGRLPVEDVVIAQVLALRADEESFLRVANVTPIRRAA